jgi:hypothetical protein
MNIWTLFITLLVGSIKCVDKFVSSTNPFTNGAYFAYQSYIIFDFTVISILGGEITGITAQDLLSNNYCRQLQSNAFPPLFTSSLMFDYATDVIKAEIALQTDLEVLPYTLFVNGPLLFVNPTSTLCPAVLRTNFPFSYLTTYLDCSTQGEGVLCAVAASTTATLISTTSTTSTRTIISTQTVGSSTTTRTSVSFLISTSVFSTDTTLTFETITTTSRTTTRTTFNEGSTDTATTLTTSVQVWTDVTDATLTLSSSTLVTTSTTVATNTITLTSVIETVSFCCN